MSSYTDYRIPILLAIPISFAMFWAASDKGYFSTTGQRDLNLPAMETTAATGDSVVDDALASVFQLRKIPVNVASTDLLQTVPGIGPKLADRIVAERERSGPFATADDLARVSGIGPKRIGQFQEYLRFD